jgi:hypothetical protein
MPIDQVGIRPTEANDVELYQKYNKQQQQLN